MALSRGRLSNSVVNVSAGSTVGIVTVAADKKIYVKSMVAHNTSGVSTARAHIYYLPNGETLSDDNKIFNISINPYESIFIEPSYPLVLTATGDQISVGSSTAALNILFSGDVEV